MGGVNPCNPRWLPRQVMALGGGVAWVSSRPAPAALPMGKMTTPRPLLPAPSILHP